MQKKGKYMQIGTIIEDRYQVIDYIDTGGTSQIYLVKHLALDQDFALKVIDNNTVKTNIDLEIESLKCLNHPQLPRIIDVIRTEAKTYIIRDYIVGENLEDYIDRCGPFDFEETVQAAQSILAVLDYLHKQEKAIIYRDLKPSNIIIKPDKQLVLIDFGTSRRYKAGGKLDTISLGTRGYAAPEQYGHKQSDARTDYYALGATIYYLYCGEHYCDNSSQTRFQRFQNKSAKLLRAVIEKATASEMQDRYQTAAEFRQALEFEQLKPTQILSVFSPNQSYNLNKLSVGVLGLSAGVGSTTVAFTLAKTVAIYVGKSAYLSRSENKHLELWQKYLEGVDFDEDLAGDSFKQAGIRFYKHYSAAKFAELSALPQQSLIIDYGAQKYLLDDFLRNQYKFFVLPAKAWALSDIEFIKDVANYQDIVFVVNLASEEELKELCLNLGIRPQRAINLSYQNDPFLLNQNHDKFREKLGFAEKRSWLQRLGVSK